MARETLGVQSNNTLETLLGPDGQPINVNIPADVQKDGIEGIIEKYLPVILPSLIGKFMSGSGQKQSGNITDAAKGFLGNSDLGG